MQITSITPQLVVTDPDESIGFYREALGAKLEEHLREGDKIARAILSIESHVFNLIKEAPDLGLLAPLSLGGSSALFALDVDDAHSVASQMIRLGSKVLAPVEDRPHGRCEGQIQDPFGHRWMPSHEIKTNADADASETSPPLKVRRIVADLAATDLTKSVDFFQQFLDLDLVMDLGQVATLSASEHSNTQLTLLTADPKAALQPHISVEVDDLDLAWHRAQECGFDIVYTRTVEPWGVERFFVRDPSGNIVNVLSHHSSTDDEHVRR